VKTASTEESVPMALYYQTEYRLGKRGRISRSYTGIQAFVAILFDLVFGLVFELVTSVISLALRLVILALELGVGVLRKTFSTLVVLMAALVFILTLPFVVLHQAVDRLRTRIDSDRRDSGAVSTVKPDWALSREV
jgi:hypothetical protein